MLRAVAALRLRIQGAKDPHDDGVAKELCALIAERGSIMNCCRQFRVVKDESIPESVIVMGIAEHGEETNQLFRVLLDLDGIRCGTLCLCHSELILIHDWLESIDGGQRIVGHERIVIENRELRIETLLLLIIFNAQSTICIVFTLVFGLWSLGWR